MRFENLTIFKQIEVMEHIHKRLNEMLFENHLKNVYCNIQNISTRERNVWGRYQSDKGGLPKEIMLSHEFVDYIKNRNDKKQIYFLVRIMLHEMVHQYCDENGIDDENHHGGWCNAAHSHGLISLYDESGVGFFDEIEDEGIIDTLQKELAHFEEQ